MNLLSIQSHVAYGHVGNAAAVFPLQRLGHEVWPVHTVQFSNHTGYGAWRGAVFDAGLIDACVEGIAERGVLPTCDGVLSGYVGGLETGAAILRAVALVKAANPAARYCCDPVIGDVGRGVFVAEGIADFFRARVIPAADVATPNQFELELLTGRDTSTSPGLRAALADLHAAGPATVLVTSVVLDDTPAEAIDCVASEGGALWRVRTPRLPISVNGAGDCVAALFFAHRLASGRADLALARAASSIFGLLERTRASGAREIALVAAQDEFVTPTRTFEAERLLTPR